MTRTAPHRPALIIDAAPSWPLTLAWDLSAVAGRALPGSRPGDHPVAIELAIEPAIEPVMGPVARGRSAAIVAAAVLGSGRRVELLARTGIPASWIRECGFEHVDIEGIVSCTAACSDRDRPIFVRCPLLAELGIPAGSYSLRADDA